MIDLRVSKKLSTSYGLFTSQWQCNKCKRVFYGYEGCCPDCDDSKCTRLMSVFSVPQLGFEFHT